MNIAIDHQSFDVDHDGVSHRGYTLAQLRDLGVPDGVLVAAVQRRLCAEVDTHAERLRTGLITPGAGQAMEYQAVQDQAAAALKASSSATAEKYPMLASSIGIDRDPQTGEAATDVVGVARSVQAARDAWLAIGAAIRGARLKGKAAITAAVTIEDAAAAHSAIAWPSITA